MDKCNQCGKSILLSKRFNNMTLCNSCASLINYPDWIDRLFESKEELIKKKEEITLLSANKEFKSDVIDAINSYFNEYINDNFITSYDGKSGQKIYIFDKYCVIKTENRLIKEKLIHIFKSFDPNIEGSNHEYEEDNDLYDGLSFAKSLLGKNKIKSGIASAISIKMKQIEEEQKEEKREYDRQKLIENSSKKIAGQILIGSDKLYLNEFSKVEIMNSNFSGYELIKFIPKGIKSNDIYECKYFFINTSNLFKAKQIRQEIERIRDILNEKFHNSDKTQKEKNVEDNSIDGIAVDLSVNDDAQKKSDPIEEVKRYKELLDSGIINQEEFDKKKKKLLNL